MPVITNHKLSVNEVIEQLQIIGAVHTGPVREALLEAIDYLEEKKGMDGEEAQKCHIDQLPM